MLHVASWETERAHMLRTYDETREGEERASGPWWQAVGRSIQREREESARPLMADRGTIP